MLIRVLGPIEVQGAVVRPREALVLGALVIRRGSGISIEELASLVWPGVQPATWHHQLHSAISRLRAALPDGAVHTDGATYRLSLAPGSIDADVLDDAAARVVRHIASGEPGRAVSLGADAVSLWRGDPIPTLAGWSERDAFASRMAERLLVIRQEMLLARARSAPATLAVRDLETAVDRDPYNERLWAALVHRHLADRRTDRALATLRRASEVFQGDLGLDLPGDLVELQTAVLRGDGLPEPPVLLRQECPYLGLEAYDESESALFFGRDRLADRVIEELLTCSVHVIVGASGIGKTSLIRAGILPRLRSRGLHATLARAPEFSLPPHPVGILIIDQIEELLDTGAEHSADVLMDGLRTHDHVLLAVRSASLDDLLQVPGMSDRIGGSVSVIGPMDREEMTQAIEGPAVASGSRLETGLTALILRDLDDASAALPHLSHALQETWVHREGDTLTVLGYESVGGIAGAVSRTAERLYEGLDPAAQEACRAVMGRLVHAPAEGTLVRRHPRTDTVALDAPSQTVIDRFAGARLLVLDGAHVALAHEALAHAWPRLRGWLDDDAAWLRTLAMLGDAAARWEDGGRSDDDLWRGARLTSVDPNSPPTLLTPSEAEFLARSRDRENNERRAERETWARERRTNIRLRTALAAVAVLLVATTGAGVLSGINATRAAEQAESEQIARLLATSLALREADRDVAALLAAEMHRRWPDDPRSRAALMGSMTSAGGYLGRTYVGGDEIAAASVTSGGAIALVDGTSMVRVSGDGTIEPIGISLPTPGGEIAVSPEGDMAVRRLDTPEATRVDIVDLGTGDIRTMSIDSRITDVSVAGGFAWALSASEVPIRIWPSPLPADVAPVPEGDRVTPAASLHSLPGGQLAYGTDAGVSVIDPANGRIVSRAPLPPGYANVLVAPGTRGTLVSSGDAGVALIDLDVGAPVWTERHRLSQQNQCSTAVVAASRGSLFCGGRRITEYSLADGTVSESTYDPGVGGAALLALDTAQTRLIAFAGTTASIAVWDLTGGGPVSHVIAAGRMAVDGFEPNGDRFVSAVAPDASALAADPGSWAVWDTGDDTAVLGPTPDLALIGWAAAGVATTWDGIEGHSDVLVDLSDGTRTPLELNRADGIAASRSGALGYSFGDSWIQPYDPATGRPTGHLIEPGDRVVTFADTLDGKLGVAWIWDPEGAAHIEVFNLRTGERLSSGLHGDNGAVPFPDGSAIVSSGSDALRVSDPDTLDPIRTLPNPGGVTTDFPQISDDGRTLLLPTHDQRVYLIDPTSGISLSDGIPSSTRDFWPGGYLRPDGGAFIVNVPEGVALWSLDQGEQFDAACRLAGRDLTPVEWSTYFGDTAPTSTCAATLAR